MDQTLANKTIAVLAANGFDELNMTEPQRALLAAGATVRIVSPEQGLVNGWHESAWGHYFQVDIPLSTALAADFDAVIVPGGVRGVDKLAGMAHTTRFLRGFMDAAKPVVAIGQAVRLLAVVERAQGRSLAADGDLTETMTAAGATVVEEQIVTDANLLTAVTNIDHDAFKKQVADHIVEVTETVAAAA